MERGKEGTVTKNGRKKKGRRHIRYLKKGKELHKKEREGEGG